MTAPFSPLPYREGALLFFFWPLPPAPGPEIEPSPPSDPFISASRRDPELSPLLFEAGWPRPTTHPTFLLLFLRFGSTNAPPRSPTHIQKARLQFKRKSPTLTIRSKVPKWLRERDSRLVSGFMDVFLTSLSSLLPFEK